MKGKFVWTMGIIIALIVVPCLSESSSVWPEEKVQPKTMDNKDLYEWGARLLGQGLLSEQEKEGLLNLLAIVALQEDYVLQKKEGLEPITREAVLLFYDYRAVLNIDDLLPGTVDVSASRDKLLSCTYITEAKQRISTEVVMGKNVREDSKEDLSDQKKAAPYLVFETVESVIRSAKINYQDRKTQVLMNYQSKRTQAKEEYLREKTLARYNFELKKAGCRDKDVDKKYILAKLEKGSGVEKIISLQIVLEYFAANGHIPGPGPVDGVWREMVEISLKALQGLVGKKQSGKIEDIPFKEMRNFLLAGTLPIKN